MSTSRERTNIGIAIAITYNVAMQRNEISFKYQHRQTSQTLNYGRVYTYEHFYKGSKCLNAKWYYILLRNAWHVIFKSDRDK